LLDAYAQRRKLDDIGTEAIIEIIPKDAFTPDLVDCPVCSGDDPTFKTAFFMTADR